ncbi:MAG: TetR/AcrR family transcriptional regulator [Acidimicrobiales bacterium]
MTTQDEEAGSDPTPVTLPDDADRSGGHRTTMRLPAATRRMQLLGIARQEFGRTGFHQTTMSDLAARAGVTKPVLYQHFASKRDLYTAVLADAGERLEEALADAVGEGGTTREQVDLGFEAYVRFVQTDRDGFRLLFSSTSRQDKEWAAIGNRVQQAVATAIAQRIDVEGMTDSHRMVLAHGIIGLAEGMMRYWHSGAADGIDFDDLLADLQTLAWGGVQGLG